jgi:hypothetical protein
MRTALAHGGTAGLLLESLAVAIPMLIIWLLRIRGAARAERAAAARRPAKRRR